MSVERSKKQVKAQPNEEDLKNNQENNNMEASKENQVTVMSPDRNQKADSSEEPMPIMSPTPYWKVAGERRKSKKFSPPITRSAKKKQGDGVLASLNVESKGLALSFSPPDQHANAQREKQELEQKKKKRASKIEHEQVEKKRLLIYSPTSMTCRNHNFDEDDAPTADNSNQDPSSPKEEDVDENQSSFELSQVETARRSTGGSQMSDMSSSSQQKPDLELRDDIKAIKATLDLVVKEKQNSVVTEVRVEQDTAALDAERSKNEQLQKENYTLQSTIGTLNAQIKTLETDKEDLSMQLLAVKKDLNETKGFLEANKADSDAISGLMAQVETLKKKEGESEKLKNDLSKMESMLAGVESSKAELEVQLEAERAEVSNLRKQLEDCDNAKKDLEAQIQKLEAGMTDRYTELGAQYKELEAEYQKVREAKEIKEKEFQNLKEKHSKTKQTFTKEKEDVEASLGQLRTSLEENVEELEKLQVESNGKSKKIEELEAALKEAVNRLSTSDQREEELLRKLTVSDKVRAALHNKVTQLSGNIRVFVRVRPSLPGEEEKLQAAENKTKRNKISLATAESPFSFPGELDLTADGEDLTKRVIQVKEPPKDRGGLSDRRKQWRYPFDAVFTPQASQEDVWQGVEPLVQSAIDGFPVCIFAYGQTGSGKTHTMLGEAGNEGLIARAVDKMFSAKRELEEISAGSTKCDMSVELLEIYNEQVRDLLVPNAGPSGREVALKVTSNEVVGNLRVPTSSEQEVMDVLSLAQSRRCVKATQSNSESSRSHMVFTLHFNVTMKNGMKRSGKLNVCDLAGSERLSKSGAQGDILKETKAINSSLSVLSNVIEKLQAGSTTIPYRESKLTFLLQNSLGGNSKTLAIVCCNPHAAHFHESLCSLRFAEKVNKVELKAIANFSC